MGTVRAIHSYAAIAFILAVIGRIYWMFAGNRFARFTKLLPFSLRRLRSFGNSFLYYSFLRREPDEYAGHNALAGASYAAVFVVYLLMIATGLVLYSLHEPVGSFLKSFEVLAPWFGGLQMARLIHHIGMWVVLIFVVVHIYFVLLSPIIEHIRTFDSIFSGYKFLPPRKGTFS